MKLYKTLAWAPANRKERIYTEFASSAGAASKARTRLKKAGCQAITTTEVEVGTSRSAFIQFLNELGAHESCGIEG